MTNDQDLRAQLEGAAGEDGRVSVEDAVEAAEKHSGPSIDDQIREAERRGDVSTSIRLKRQRSGKALADARSRADGGAAR